jgi:hypothetical protein
VHVVVDSRPPEREALQPELRLPPSPHDATGGGYPWLLVWEREGGGGGEESRAREDDRGGEGSEIRVGVGWVGGWVGVLGKVVGWWEGVFAKESGGACKNDTNIEFLLLSIEIKISVRAFAQMF